MHKDLVRSFETEAFSGAVVEAMHGMSDVIFGDRVKAHLLGKELPDQATHVFVGSPLP